MALTATDKGGSIVLAPAGTWVARCYMIADLGTQPETFQGKPKPMHKIRIAFELPDQKHTFDEKKGPEPYTLSKKYTASTNEKGNLRRDLEAWRGRPFSDEEIKLFKIGKLIGVGCLLTVIHKKSQKGSVYATITGIMKPMKDQVIPPAVNAPIVYEIEEKEGGNFARLPDWIKDEVRNSIEFRGVTPSSGGAAATEDHESGGEGDGNDPF